MTVLTRAGAIDHMPGVRGMPIMGKTAQHPMWPWLAIALLCAVEVAALAIFASWHLSRTAFWYDESMQFWMSLGLDGFGPPHMPLGSFWDVVRNNAIANLDPGGFTIVMWLWLKLATDEIWQRALPFIFFLLGMACFGWMGWTRRRSIPFAVFSSLILAWDPLVLDYATEVRAYSMEFAGIAFGCVLLDKLTFHRETLPALFTGIVFAAFLGSRYSFGLFAAAAFLALAVITFGDTSINRRQGAMRLAAFAAPTAIAATVIFVVAFLPQYKIRMSSDGGAYLQYLAASTAAGKSWNDLLTMLARNLLGPSGIALTLSALLGAAWLTPWRARLGLGQVSNADALFSLLSLAAILVSALVWRWHPWDMTQKWSLWLHALSAAAIVRLMSSVLAWAVPPSASGFETSARLAAVIIVSVLALDLRLASYRRGGNDLIPVLVYLERARPVRGSVAVDRYWYPTLRYFYEYGPFVSSSLYPSSFRLPNWSGPKPLVSWQTRYLVTSRTLQQARSFFTTTLREIRISRISCFGSSRSLHPLCIPMTEVSSRQNSDRSSGPRVVIVGAGFTGLAAGYELAKRKLRPTILEAEPEPGGLAGTFNVGDTRLERFYHHWFTNDRFLMELATELGLANSLIYRHARTGIYYANSMLRLSSPLDVLRFQPLSVVDRLRLGVVVLAARTIRRWQDLDDKPAAVWLRQVCGEKAYRIVWEPLLRGKFGVHADQISRHGSGQS